MHAPMAAIAVRISMVQTTSPATPPKTLPSQAHVDQPLGREPINLERPADVRFGADNGLMSDMAPCPKSAMSRPACPVEAIGD
jgi:hypothetical protein